MERRRLHNDIQELRGNIRVFCRVRPLLPEERERQRGMPHLHFPSQDTRSLVLTRPDDSQLGRERRAELRYDFSFDRVFPPAASQEEIFQEIQLLVQLALDGYPVCIFAYGQTGSGSELESGAWHPTTTSCTSPTPPGCPWRARSSLSDPGGPGGLRAPGEVGIRGEPASGDTKH
ncbi:carboxy-terminal kinesin 2 [Taeniopygia guttata]|uniref:carboxy-terminal kinesin 2 n=1 Tax=Taeniopygia guttata TaxID=59729 RepID=UPI003BB94591